MEIRRKSSLAMAALLAAGLSAACTAEASRARDTNATKPDDSSGRVEVTEEIWYPWRFEPMIWEDNAWMHYRRHEEKEAAVELRKAESWLKFAGLHALPQSREALQRAASDLDSLATDLEHGQVEQAIVLRDALARADHALAQWHYFKARGRSDKADAAAEEADAALNLRTAARYLEHAAASVYDENGPETTTFFEDIDEYGRIIDQGVSIEPAQLARYLDAIQRELDRMAKTLETTAESPAAG